MLDVVFWAPVMVGGTLAGASSGVLGTFIVGMRIPFLGVCVAHAALAGAVFGGLAGLTGQALLLPALAGAILTALALGLVNPQRARLDDNTMLSFLFSTTMGLAFLGIGLYGILGRSDHDVRSLLWGSLNFCRWTDVRLMLLASLALAAYLAVFFKELRAILFSRADAEAAGIRATAVWTGFLVLAAAILTVNFQTVGGLMIYSLISNPAAAAFQLGSRLSARPAPVRRVRRPQRLGGLPDRGRHRLAKRRGDRPPLLRPAARRRAPPPTQRTFKWRSAKSRYCCQS
ncbi:MAG: metal ABC transporter permease [Verrucomicrobiales bacterium]|nr:metal ABC transporter permease [Verrucomicrobiales bacterium]